MASKRSGTDGSRGFNISDFKAFRDSRSVLRTHDYLMEIPIPTGLRGSATDQGALVEANHSIEFSCESVNFPLTGIYTHGVQRYSYGAIETKPLLPKFGPLQCMFVSDSEAHLYKFFHEWIKTAVNYEFRETQYTNGVATAYEINYKLEYAVDMNLYMYDPHGTLVRHIGFREAYPTDVGDVQLSWGRLNEIVKIPVAFTFFDWHEYQVVNGQSLPDSG